MMMKSSKKKNEFIITPLIPEISETNDKKSSNGKKPNKFYLKCAQKRKEQGLSAILPPNIESKIYRLKKSLIKKGIDGGQIKQIVRQRRRHEELRFRKDLKHVCFKCRQPGHSIVNCPQISNDESIVTNICYFCGSIEHKLSECPGYRKKQHQPGQPPVLPFADCFICHQKGHLTRHCPRNQNGAFPQGGNCRRCGAIDHTFKECHLYTRTNTRDEPIEAMLTRYDDLNHGVDVDDLSATNNAVPKPNENKKKIVKF